MTLKRIYEIDSVTVESLNGTALWMSTIHTTIKDIEEQIFTYTLISTHAGIIEFIHSDQLKQWFTRRHLIENKFNVQITLCLRYWNDETTISPEPKITTPIKREVILTPAWLMVAAHPIFGIEYKTYIRNDH